MQKLINKITVKKIYLSNNLIGEASTCGTRTLIKLCQEDDFIKKKLDICTLRT